MAARAPPQLAVLAIFISALVIGNTAADCALSPKPAGFPDNVDFADYACHNTPSSVSCTVRCPPGFRVVGGTDIVCDGISWVGTVPSCELIRCPEYLPPLGAPPESLTSCTGRDVGVTCTTTCPEPYIQNGGTSRTCKSDGTWSGERGTCIRPATLDVVNHNLELVVGEAQDVAAVLGSTRVSLRQVNTKLITHSDTLAEHRSEIDLATMRVSATERTLEAQNDTMHMWYGDSSTPSTILGNAAGITQLDQDKCEVATCNSLNSAIGSLQGSGCTATVCEVNAKVMAAQGSGCTESVCSLKSRIDSLETTTIASLQADITGHTLEIGGLSELLDELLDNHAQLNATHIEHMTNTSLLARLIADEATNREEADTELSGRIDGLVESLNGLTATVNGKVSAADLAAYVKTDALDTKLSDYVKVADASFPTLADFNALKARVDQLETDVKILNVHRDGNWHLVMKIKQGSTTFTYDSSYWTDDNLLNNIDLTLDPNDAKYASFLQQPVTEVRVCVGTPTTNCFSTNLGKTYTNSKALFNAGYQRGFITQSSWITIFSGTGAKNCGMQRPGFNTVCSDSNRARWGFCNNVPSQACQESDASDADGAIGIGIHGQNPNHWGAGFNGYYESDDSTYHGKSFNAWLWVA